MPCDILIIDDDQDDLEILCDAFTQCGISCVNCVYTASEAFIYLQRIGDKGELPKLIVTDLHLPAMTGDQFVADLKTMDLYQHIPVIVLSSTANEREIEKYREMGIAEYLVKPSSYDGYVEVAKQVKEKFLGS